MTCKDIYRNALAILAESMIEGDNADFEERAPYLLANFCTELFDRDSAIRHFLGEAQGEEFQSVFLPLESDFPLLSRFAPAAAIYLAAMLIADDNQEFHEKLYERYCDTISSVCENISAISEKILNRYFYD